IVTNCSRETTNSVIAALPMAPFFWDVIVTRDDVDGKTKPHPYPWLLASYKLGIPISQCLAIDNKDSGIIAAVEAGAKTARVNSPCQLTEGFLATTLRRLEMGI